MYVDVLLYMCSYIPRRSEASNADLFMCTKYNNFNNLLQFSWERSGPSFV